MDRFTVTPISNTGKLVTEKTLGFGSVEEIAKHFNVLTSSLHHHFAMNVAGDLTYKRHKLVDNGQEIEQLRMKQKEEELRKAIYAQAKADLEKEAGVNRRGRPKKDENVDD